MSINERTGTRDLLYSGWHRPNSIRRYLGPKRAAQLKVIDIDWCEACNWCNQPLALIETQRSTSEPKPATITALLAEMAGIPAFSVSYQPTGDNTDIHCFRVRSLTPFTGLSWEYTPDAYAEWLWQLRADHDPECAVLRARP